MFYFFQGKEKKTSFNGSVITLDAKANMATDLIKFVVTQKISPVEMAYKVLYVACPEG